MHRILSFFSGLAARLVPHDEEVVQAEAPGLLRAVEEARREWMVAKAHFENVSDPELVDHAIYLMEAAQRKYMCVLRQAREENVTHPLEP
ncbi:MAG: YaaL family protein [Bacillota bacterium]|jgi:hypothetical protein